MGKDNMRGMMDKAMDKSNGKLPKSKGLKIEKADGKSISNKDCDIRKAFDRKMPNPKPGAQRTGMNPAASNKKGSNWY